MKLAITDACILIDLHKLQLTIPFFELSIEVHTSLDVYNELDDDQKQILLAFRSVGKFTIHSIQEKERLAIHQGPYSKGLSEADKTALFLADQLNAMILSSDKTVRKHAKNNTIEYHGMLWILDELVLSFKISKAEASAKLKQLIDDNQFYQNNLELCSEIDKRIQTWNS